MPRTFTYTETRCADCEFHNSKLWKHVRIGNNEYRHTCLHPKWKTWSVLYAGRLIGATDRVPAWCPLKEETTQGTEEPQC